MAKATLELDGTQMIETLKEATMLMDDIIIKAERLQSLFVGKESFLTIAPTIHITNGADVGRIVSSITETIEKEIESAKSNI